jgi:hypothetical protein
MFCPNQAKLLGSYKRKNCSQTEQNCQVSIIEKWVLNHPKERERERERKSSMQIEVG